MNNSFQDTFSYKLIYVFGINSKSHEGLLKIGEATISGISSFHLINDNSEELNKAAKLRIDDYTKTAGINYELFYTTLAITNDNKPFRDNDVHAVLKRSNIIQPKQKLNGALEWFKTDLSTVKKAINAVKQGKTSLHPSEVTKGKTPIIFRPEQKEAISKTIKQFSVRGKEKNANAHMLWNAKMRFGKTLSALEVVKQMNFSKTLIITHRPVVKHGWFEDFDKIFYDNRQFTFGSKTFGSNLEKLIDLSKKDNIKYVYFASIQDLRGSSLVGGKYDKNNELFQTKWDFIIIDEAHEGTQTSLGNEVIQTLIESTNKTKTLYLSGTPFNLLSAESKQTFKEDEVYTWDYVMEQRAKLDWVEKYFGDSNPYESLPKMNIFTYDLGKIITDSKYQDIEDTAFNFKEFFRVWTGDAELDKANPNDKVEVGSFVYERDIVKFLDLLVESGEHNYPFSSQEYRDNFRHTLWMIPGVKEARALSRLMRNHRVFQHFDIVNVAGDGDEEVRSDDAYNMVMTAISEKPEETRTITLSCGRLTTGVSIPAWSAVFMLSGSSSTSASSYLQTIFRVQTPATIGSKTKTNCYVFDFAPDRTLKMVAEAGNLSVKTGAINDNKMQMGEFLNFCPVIAISGSEMRAYSTDNMLVQLKRALVDRVAKNGFDDRHLYNDRLLQLTDVEVQKFQELKRILKASKATKTEGDILINDQGVDAELREAIKKEQSKKELTEEEKARLEERRRKLRERSSAIAILRGIAIRIPLMVYGADIDINQKIDVDNFPKLIDEKSWEEFMPKGVTKEKFSEFSKYFDNEIFVEAGLKIRRQAKAADELPPLERVEAIANIFATFKNPDRETVLTPWRAVNMHMGETLGGANFYDEKYENMLKIDLNSSTRWIDKKDIVKNTFNIESKVLEINSKSGLYPLYAAVSIYQDVKYKGRIKNIKTLWQDILRDNIFVICRTEMAAAITRRTLKGFKNDSEFKTNIIVLEDIVNQMTTQYKNNYSELISLIKSNKTWQRGEGIMKFNAVVGNPPYQSEAKQQIYTDFYLLSRELGEVVSLIFPTGWQEPKTANNLSKLNNEAIKKDKQIVFIDNRQNVFPGITGAEWTNFILWKKGYDNELDGAQLIFTNGNNEEEIVLPIKKTDIEKPIEIVNLAKIIKKDKNFESMTKIVSSLKPYGLRTDFLNNPSKYGLPMYNINKKYDTDIKIYGLLDRRQSQVYISNDYPLPNRTDSLNSYKVFVGKAWGNWSDNYLGGAYSDIIVGSPLEICTENFLEIGNFSEKNTALKMAKYLMTRFTRALLFLNKFSQDNSKDKFKSIPIQDFTEKWWSESIDEIEENLFNKYNVPENIRTFIRKNVQRKTEENIINKV